MKNGTIHIYIYVYAAISDGKQKTEIQGIFLSLFTVCSSCKRKFVLCPFVDEETNGSYPFANGLNRLNGLKKKKLLSGQDAPAYFLHLFQYYTLIEKFS
jgi:hypothetical protein